MAIAERWGEIAALAKLRGRPRPIIDSVLAATAICHDLTLATRNGMDYEDLGVTIINPWDGA